MGQKIIIYITLCVRQGDLEDVTNFEKLLILWDFVKYILIQ